MPFASKRNVLFAGLEFATEEQRDLYDFIYEASLDHETETGTTLWGMAMHIGSKHPDWTYWEVVAELRRKTRIPKV